jgi:hypothetical protein
MCVESSAESRAQSALFKEGVLGLALKNLSHQEVLVAGYIAAVSSQALNLRSDFRRTLIKTDSCVP